MTELMLFIISVIVIDIRSLRMSANMLQEEVPWQNLYCKQGETVVSQYRKRFTV
jgi:hypothetical protein